MDSQSDTPNRTRHLVPVVMVRVVVGAIAATTLPAAGRRIVTARAKALGMGSEYRTRLGLVK